MQEFEDLMEQSKTQAVVIDFTASWCPPCRFIAPVFEKIAAETPQVIFVKVDVDEAREISSKCGIRAMPTFQFFKGGVKVDEMCGASEEKLRELVTKYAAD